ncbi:MAG: hypothetical protein IPO87_16650 [Flavobacteriales bacterium]|nr:hypothetical protein [Flavobacteriales bacterium]
MARTLHNWTDYLLIAVIALFELSVTAVALLWLFTNSFANYKAGLGIIEPWGINEHITYGWFLSGALGGAFYCLRAIYQRIGEAYTPIREEERKEPNLVFNPRAWAFWYLVRPLMSGVLALILLCLVKSDLLTVTELAGKDIGSFYVLIALGFLAGFGSHELIHKIEEVIRVLFAKATSTGSNAAKKVDENKGK